MSAATVEDTPDDHDNPGITREQLAQFVARQNLLRQLREENDRLACWQD